MDPQSHAEGHKEAEAAQSTHRLVNLLPLFTWLPDPRSSAFIRVHPRRPRSAAGIRLIELMRGNSVGPWSSNR